MKKTLDNYDYEKKECHDLVSKQIMDKGFDSHRSSVYQKIRNELIRSEIYDEDYIDEVIVQIDNRIKSDIEEVYDEYGSMDNNLSKKIESICVEEIRGFKGKLEKDDEVKTNNDKDSKFSNELQSLTNSVDDVVNRDIESFDKDKKNKIKDSRTTLESLFK